MADYKISGTTLTTIADTIREKVGTKETYTPLEIPAGVESVYKKGVADGRALSVDSPLPMEVVSEEQMSELLLNATSESVGAVYKYIGETTEAYENGALYIIAEE